MLVKGLGVLPVKTRAKAGTGGWWYIRSGAERCQEARDGLIPRGKVYFLFDVPSLFRKRVQVITPEWLLGIYWKTMLVELIVK